MIMRPTLPLGTSLFTVALLPGDALALRPPHARPRHLWFALRQYHHRRQGPRGAPQHLSSFGGCRSLCFAAPAQGSAALAQVIDSRGNPTVECDLTTEVRCLPAPNPSPPSPRAQRRQHRTPLLLRRAVSFPWIPILLGTTWREDGRGRTRPRKS